MSEPSTIAAPLTAALIGRTSSEPRVIQQFTSIFLVGRAGELWRVYDSSSSSGADRTMPSPESSGRFRLFLGLARKSEMRAYRFTADTSREIDPVSLQKQLDASRAV
ncbi:MAG TPA: hypothetical protein VGM82_04890 [Gemmatimonadaceae bacterium]|jgi:hypothetical protein